MTEQSKQTKHTLNDLIAIARDGQSFYEEAAQKVDDVELKSLFARIAGTKATLVQQLGAVVQAAGESPTSSGTFVGTLQELYGKTRAVFGDKTYGYVAELEESEDRLLEAFESAAQDEDTPADARAVVIRLLPDVRATHDVMRARKLAMKQAS